MKTPLDLSGFRMPAEWEPHEATWLTWPHREEHWPGKFQITHPIWARMVKELESGEEVHLLIHDDATEKIAKEAMRTAGVTGRQVHLHRVPNNYAWARDHGPIFVKNGKDRLILNWQFNGWGNKWEHDLDNEVPLHVSKITGIPAQNVPMVLEGGSIDVNGQGTLLTTEACLLNKNRNPHLSKSQIEEFLKTHLGVSTIIWLGEGIVGDDTDGHVDDMTRFVNPTTVVTAVEEDPADENYKILKENFNRLKKTGLTVAPLPMPGPVLYEGERLPASYANFYIGNKVV
ncbi:MAG: agmatine deiminase family protein, partial [Deltaproteobacteria bacterium]|nr:agmatine deiminase family protein [Deltaproteobacteria bacterium]